MHRAAVVLLIAGVLATEHAIAQPPPHSPPGGTFRQITARSGVAEIIEQEYRQDRKWWLSGLYLMDLDGDGNLDFVTGAHGGGGPIAALGDGKGGFNPGGSILTGVTRNETNIHYADVRGNGRIDLIVHWGRYDNPAGQSRVFFNDGKMSFTDVTKQIGLSDQDGFAIKGVGDVNQDGFPDLLVLENKRPEIYLNDGLGHFRKKQGALIGMETARKPVYVSWGLAVVTDLDSDGVADILWNGRNFLWVLRGNGDGTFTYRNKAWGIEDYSKATVDEGLCFGDIDGDGALEIIGFAADRERARVNVYHNELPKRNWINIRPIGAPGNRVASGAKIRISASGEPHRLLWCEQVQIIASQSAHSDYSHAQTERHFGLGDRAVVDVSVEFYPSRKKVEKKGIRANRTIVCSEESGQIGEAQTNGDK